MHTLSKANDVKTVFILGKILAIFLVLALALSMLSLWFQTYLVGAYYVNSGLFLALIVGSSPVLIVVIALLVIRALKNLKLSDIVGQE